MSKNLISKKSLISLGIFLICLALLWVVVIIPQDNKISQLKKDFFNYDHQIDQISKYIGDKNSITEGLVLMEQEFKSLDKKFPEKEEEALEMLSELARDLNLEVVSLKPSKKVDFLTEDGHNLTFESKTIKKILVSMEVKGSYKSLTKYIMTLKELLPAFISIEELKISKSLKQSAILSINLKVNIFLLS